MKAGILMAWAFGACMSFSGMIVVGAVNSPYPSLQGLMLTGVGLGMIGSGCFICGENRQKLRYKNKHED